MPSGLEDYIHARRQDLTEISGWWTMSLIPALPPTPVPAPPSEPGQEVGADPGGLIEDGSGASCGKGNGLRPQPKLLLQFMGRASCRGKGNGLRTVPQF